MILGFIQIFIKIGTILAGKLWSYMTLDDLEVILQLMKILSLYNVDMLEKI